MGNFVEIQSAQAATDAYKVLKGSIPGTLCRKDAYDGTSVPLPEAQDFITLISTLSNTAAAYTTHILGGEHMQRAVAETYPEAWSETGTNALIDRPACRVLNALAYSPAYGLRPAEADRILRLHDALHAVEAYCPTRITLHPSGWDINSWRVKYISDAHRYNASDDLCIRLRAAVFHGNMGVPSAPDDYLMWLHLRLPDSDHTRAIKEELARFKQAHDDMMAFYTAWLWAPSIEGRASEATKVWRTHYPHNYLRRAIDGLSAPFEILPDAVTSSLDSLGTSESDVKKRKSELTRDIREGRITLLPGCTASLKPPPKDKSYLAALASWWRNSACLSTTYVMHAVQEAKDPFANYHSRLYLPMLRVGGADPVASPPPYHSPARIGRQNMPRVWWGFPQ